MSYNKNSIEYYFAPRIIMAYHIIKDNIYDEGCANYCSTTATTNMVKTTVFTEHLSKRTANSFVLCDTMIRARHSYPVSRNFMMLFIPSLYLRFKLFRMVAQFVHVVSCYVGIVIWCSGECVIHWVLDFTTGFML